MSQLTRILTIELFGEQHKFQTEDNDPNAEAIIRYLEDKVAEAGRKMKSPGKDVNKLAQLLLAALNITSEYFDTKGKHETVLKIVESRSSKIVKNIDAQLS